MSETVSIPRKQAVDLLRDRMSDISEEHYCAGWLGGNEHYIYSALCGGDRHYGMGEISDEALAEVRALSEALDGWHDGNVFVPMSEWKARHKAWQEAQ